MASYEAINILLDARDIFSDREDWQAVDETDALLCICYQADPTDICTPEFEERVRAHADAA